MYEDQKMKMQKPKNALGMKSVTLLVRNNQVVDSNRKIIGRIQKMNCAYFQMKL